MRTIRHKRSDTVLRGVDGDTSMGYENKTIGQLISELKENRQWLVELESLIPRLQQAQEALSDFEEKYRIYFSLSNDVMLSFDNHLCVVSVSPNVERLLGYTPEELIGSTLPELVVLDPKDQEEACDHALHVLSRGVSYSSIYQFISKDGVRKFGEVTGIPFVKEGRIVGFITVAKDITERVNA